MPGSPSLKPINQNLLTGTATDARVILGDAVGTLSLRAEQQPVAPCLSIGGDFV